MAPTKKTGIERNGKSANSAVSVRQDPPVGSTPAHILGTTRPAGVDTSGKLGRFCASGKDKTSSLDPT